MTKEYNARAPPAPSWRERPLVPLVVGHRTHSLLAGADAIGGTRG